MKELIVQLKHWLLLNLAEKRCAVHCEKEITTELDLGVPGQLWVGLAGPQTQLGGSWGDPQPKRQQKSSRRLFPGTRTIPHGLCAPSPRVRDKEPQTRLCAEKDKSSFILRWFRLEVQRGESKRLCHFEHLYCRILRKSDLLFPLTPSLNAFLNNRFWGKANLTSLGLEIWFGFQTCDSTTLSRFQLTRIFS